MTEKDQDQIDVSELLIPTEHGHHHHHSHHQDDHHHHHHHHKKKRRKKRCWWMVLLAILACLLAAVITFVVLSLPLFGGLALKAPAAAVIENTVQTEPTLDEVEVEVTPDLPPQKEVQNIAIFGIDQEKGSVGRSDAIMILSIDRVNNKIKMITLDRDSLVAIDGHGKRLPRDKTEDICTDVEVQAGTGALNHPAVMTVLAKKIAGSALEKARGLGLRGHFYARLATAAGGSAGSSYFGTRNSLSFLVETSGQLNAGGYYLERRVLSQYAAVFWVK